jgi:ABC-type Fe3+ transport system substrate-binding protein
LNIGLLNRASGSRWWTADGKLSGLSIASTKTFDYGYTVILDLSNLEVKNYLQPLIDDSWARYNASIPEPTTLALVASTLGALALRRRRED